MESYSDEFVKQIYNLPKTPEAVSEFLNSEWLEELPNGKVAHRMMWERFEGSYVKVTRHYAEGTPDDEGDLYLYAHKLVSRCVLAEVAPYFESDGQLFSYFQLMVKNTRINNAVKQDKQSFLLIDDLVSKEDAEESDYSNFENKVMSVEQPTDYDDGGLYSVYASIDSLDDPDLITFGRLFVQNDFSFDGLYGLCGFDLQKFKDVKKRFIASMREIYADRK